MAVSKSCPSCGAENDLIYTNCLFCKTPLPNLDINSISNDDLIMKATEWVGKSREQTIKIEGKSGNLLDLIGGKMINHSEIVSNAEKYLNLLSVRAQSNDEIKRVFQDLKIDFENNKKKAKRKSPAYVLMYMVVLLAVVLIPLLFLARGEANEEEEAIKKLDQIELKIEEAVKEKDYDYALILVEKLVFNLKDQKITDQYTEKRNSLRETIFKMRAKKKGE